MTRRAIPNTTNGRPSAPRSRRPSRAHAFTLLELLCVMTLVATLAVGAAPALHRVSATRDAALARELGRRLSVARDFAIATGRPTGVRLDAGLRNVWQIWIPSDGATPTPAPDALGNPSERQAVSGILGGGTIASFTNGDGSATNTTIWFDADGTPHLRKNGGAYIGPFTTDASIAVGAAPAVLVRRASGAVEQ